MKLLKRSATLLLILVFLLSATGCVRYVYITPAPSGSGTTPAGGGSPAKSASSAKSATPAKSAASNLLQLNIKAAAPIALTLESYNGSFYTVKKPKGWQIETTGEYENFGFRMYDPAKPQRQIFFYGNMTPFLKSDAAKTAWETYLATGGFSSAQLYADAPVLEPATTEEFLKTFNDFTDLAHQYGIVHDFASLDGIEVLESVARSSPMASVALDDTIARAIFTQDGIPCEGLFGASVVDSMQSFMYGTDAGYYTVYVITGITAPTEEFGQLEASMAEVLGSFAFTQSYIDQGVANIKWQTAAALKVGQTMAAAADAYNQAWRARQKSNDALSQIRSDTMLGYERVVDSATGNVYRVETGAMDAYNADPTKYTNPNLTLVGATNAEAYGSPISGYITK